MQGALFQFASYMRVALEIYSWLHIVAFLLSWIDADPYNSIVSFINRCTMPLWNWVGQYLPRSFSLFSPIAALMLIYYCEIAVPGVFYTVGSGMIGALELHSSLFDIVLYLFVAFISVSHQIAGFILILAIIWFVMTLVNPPLNSPFTRTIMHLVDPLISPLQRILPRAKIDLSPIILAALAFLLQSGLAKLFSYSIYSFHLSTF